MAQILGRWNGYDDMKGDWFETDWSLEPPTFKASDVPETFPREDELLFASYGGGAYEGDALILWKRDGKLYEAHGSHCSCYGLEGQFEPEETSIAALSMRERPGTSEYGWHYLHDHDPESVSAYWALVDSMVAQA